MVMAMLVLAMALTLTSCSEISMCPSYGGVKRMTSHGHKAQARYAKHVRGSI